MYQCLLVFSYLLTAMPGVHIPELQSVVSKCVQQGGALPSEMVMVASSVLKLCK